MQSMASSQDEGGFRKDMWAEYWGKIEADPQTNQFWRAGSEESHKVVTAFLLEAAKGEQLLSKAAAEGRRLTVLIPLSGDDPAAKAFLEAGCDVVCVEGVSRAVQALKTSLATGAEEQWSQRSSGPFTVWSHQRESGNTATVLEGSLFDLEHHNPLPAHQVFDVLYDRDAFGAIEPATRPLYAKIVLSLFPEPRPAIFYVEAKFRTGERFDTEGPPYHVPLDALLLHYALPFQALPDLYDKGPPDRRTKFWLAKRS